MPDFPGFRIERELGRGAMAVVYLATQLSLKRPVALKVLDRNVDNYQGLAQRFIHEAHTLAGLQHRNIVHVHDVVESEQGDYISMEFLNGGSLGDRLSLGMTVQQSLAILAQLGSALDAAHAAGIVHRDIKPDNVLFRDADTPVLADFGIARELASDVHLTQDGLVLGTPGYMAPEQISGIPIDGRADQYSLGAMWFQMLTGHLPYQADSTTNLLFAHLSRAIPALPATLAPLQPVINRMLAKSPDARYPDMAAMLLDVSRHLLRAPELLRAPPGMPQVSPTERLHQLGFLTTGMQAAESTQVLGMAPGVNANTQGRKVPKQGFRMAALVLAALSIGLLALGLWFRHDSPAAAPAQPAAAVVRADNSIAVLPFVSLSADKDQEFFADGISEELLNQLAKIPELRVIARTSSFAFKGKDVGVREIARQLGVTHVLEGSIRRSGNKLRITAQLIRTSDSSHLWAETYDRELTDIFAVQDEISLAVVDQLKLKLLGGAPKATAVNPQAYALFLEARSISRKGTAASWMQALALLEKAIRIDPAYAEAWTGISRLQYFLASSMAGTESAEHVVLSRAAANQSLAIDPDFAPARVALAGLSMTFDHDLPEAARQMVQALRLAPDDYDVQFASSTLLAYLGRRKEWLASTEALAARDPGNPAPFASMGFAYLTAGQFDDAIASFRKVLQLSPGRPSMHANIATCLIAKGDPRAGLAEMQLEPEEGKLWREIGFTTVWHALGEDAKAEAALAELIRDFEKDDAYNIAYVQARLGHTEAAFEWLEKALAYRDPGLAEVLFDDWRFAAIHADPRWLKFLQKIGRAPEQLAAIKFNVGTIK